MRCVVVSGLLLAMWAVSPFVAHADIISPEESACRNAREGDACFAESVTDGTCQPDQCCRLDYSMGSPPMGTICSDCLTCQSNPEPDAGMADTDMASTDDSGGDNSSTDDAVASGEDVASSGESGEGEDEDDGCASMGRSGGATPAISFVLGLGLLVVVRRRIRKDGRS